MQVAGTVYASCLSDFVDDFALLMGHPAPAMAPAELAQALSDLAAFMADHGMHACIEVLMAGAAAQSLHREQLEGESSSAAAAAAASCSAAGAAPAPTAAAARPGLRDVVLGCRSARQVRAAAARGSPRQLRLLGEGLSDDAGVSLPRCMVGSLPRAAAMRPGARGSARQHPGVGVACRSARTSSGRRSI
jgi:hypothetical protein